VDGERRGRERATKCEIQKGEVPISKVLTGVRFDADRSVGICFFEVAETNRISALSLAPPQTWTNWVCFELLDRRALYDSKRI
jgi:hypothetical protein